MRVNQPQTKTQRYSQTPKTQHTKNNCNKTLPNHDSDSHLTQPYPKQSKDNNKKTRIHHPLLIGTKIGICDICKKTTNTLLLRYGFTLCEDCLSVCTSLLDQINLLTNTPLSEQGSIGSRPTNKSSMEPNEASL
jgi:hypothetical protein